MQLIAGSDLIVAEGRQRKDVPSTHIEQLAHSIFTHGLFHPILLEDDEKTLRAGFCRSQAMGLLHQQKKKFFFNNEEVPQGMMPYTRLGVLTSVQRFEIELEENIRRKDLSVMEKAAAVAALHQLKREAQPEWTNRDTAETIQNLEGGSMSALEAEVADSLLIEAMADDPDVKQAAATSRSRAAHVARKKIEAELSSAVAETLPENPDQILIKGDAFEVLPTLQPSFDGIIADPPYGVAADQFGDLTKEHNYEDSLEEAEKWVHLIGSEGFRLTRDEAHLYLFCDIVLFPRWASILTTYGWWVWRTPLIWHKPNSKRVPQIDFGPGRSYEAILYAIKGRRPLRNKGKSDVLSYSLESGDHRHPAGKPRDLYTDLLNRSFAPGDLVLDPSTGGGRIFPAGRALQIRVLGVEKDDEWAAFALAQARGE